MTTTPRTEHAKDLVSALKNRDTALGTLGDSLEKLGVLWASFAENILYPCEMCEGKFSRNEEDVKNKEMMCHACRPAPKCDECDCELAPGEEYMCPDCTFAFRL